MATSTTSFSATMTPTKLRAWFAKHGAAIAELIRLRKFAETEKARVWAYELPLLQEFQFKDVDTGELILKTEGLYGLSEADEARMPGFWERCFDLHTAHGWTGERGHCPASTALYAAINQEHKLIPHIADFMGVTVQQMQYSYRVTKEAVDLVIKFYQGR